MRGPKLCVLLGLIAVTLPANADWQYTKWDMPLDDVVAASQGSVHAVKPTKEKRLRDFDRYAEGVWHNGDITYRADFYFDDAMRLKLVNLYADPAQCPAVTSELEAARGKPDEARDTFAKIWHDAANGNDVIVTEISRKFCFVSYAPLGYADSKGAKRD